MRVRGGGTGLPAKDARVPLLNLGCSEPSCQLYSHAPKEIATDRSFMSKGSQFIQLMARVLRCVPVTVSGFVCSSTTRRMFEACMYTYIYIYMYLFL